jgi:ribonuclease Z
MTNCYAASGLVSSFILPHYPLPTVRFPPIPNPLIPLPSPMHLILLGTGGYHPNDSRHTPCILLPECGIMLDAGTAAYRAAKYLQTAELDIFLTHAHLDHVIGLTYLFDVLYEHPLRRVTVHAAPDKLAAVEQHLFAPLLFPKKPPFESRPLADMVALPQGGRLTHFPVQHPGGVLGFRLDWPGHSLAYITDTTATADAAYVERIRGVDLLLHECYFADGKAEADWAQKTGHSCTTPVAELARRAGVGRLILLHINPLATADDPVGLDAARSIFPHTEIGKDLMEVEV